MVDYAKNETFAIDCGFSVTCNSVVEAMSQTNRILKDLPSTLYRSIDYKTTSAMIGAIFCDTLAAALTDCLVNPIEKGHPDIIPLCGKDCSEAELRNYPQGLEVKTTVGNIARGANLRAGQTRIKYLEGITWQAHHREVTELLGLVWDFVNDGTEFNFPVITAAFYANDLTQDDWGKISGTEGRNTKVTGMLSSGKTKMGLGWIAILNDDDYINAYTSHLRIRHFQRDADLFDR